MVFGVREELCDGLEEVALRRGLTPMGLEDQGKRLRPDWCPRS